MSSRFFKAVSDSESESSEPEAEALPQRPAGAQIGGGYSFSDDEEDTKRQVRSAKDKHSEQIHDLIKSIKNSKKIKDFTKILPDFEELTRKYAKVKSILDKESDGKTPRFLIKSLVELEDFVEQCWEDRAARKNMNKNNSKAFSSLRQKLRKYNKSIQNEIDAYRESPDAEDGDKSDKSDAESSESEDDDDGESESDVRVADVKDDKEKFKVSVSESDDSDWGSSSDESSLSSDDEKYGDNLAARFLKRQDEKDKETTVKRTKKVKTQSAKDKRKGHEDEDDKGWEQVRGGLISGERPKMFASDSEINHQNVLKKLIEVLAMRGKKRVDRSDQTEMLVELLNLSRQYKLGPAIEIRILLGIIASLFEYNPNVSDCLKVSIWEEVLRYINMLLDTLMANLTVNVSSTIDEDGESYEKEPYQVSGCPIALVERMDEEFNKILQNSDAHSPEYVERLKHERTVCRIIDRLQEYVETKETKPNDLCRVYLLKIDHLYYKFDQNVIKQKKQQEKNQPKNEDPRFRQVEIVIKDQGKSDEDLITNSSVDIMNQLCKYIYSNDTTARATTRAILAHIYHHALHDNYFEARDLMLMSHLQGNINKADVPLQIMYNRALVQLGLCAFRQGYIQDSHSALLDIQILGKAREFLAQGLPLRHQEKTPEQEKLERRRQVPFHKHINLDLLECVYLVSSMLLEMPDVAANEFSVRKKMISRLFYNQLRKSEEQPLVGLPETTREHVVAASKAMRVGNWKQCRDLIINDKVNLKVWNLFHQSDSVRAMLEQKIREGSLRAYLFTYSNVYDSISMEVLSKMFDLEKSTVHSIVSKMIINEELMASLDEPTQSVVMHRTEPSRLQGLALQMAEKINYLVDQNYRVWDVKQFGVDRGGDRRNNAGGDRTFNKRERNDRYDKGDRERNDRGDRGGDRHEGRNRRDHD